MICNERSLLLGSHLAFVIFFGSQVAFVVVPFVCLMFVYLLQRLIENLPSKKVYCKKNGWV